LQRVFYFYLRYFGVVEKKEKGFVHFSHFSRDQKFGYECGFESFNPTRAPFDIQFYRFAILFIILDLELAFLFP